MTRRKYVVGNWKMNGTAGDLDEARAIAAAVPDTVDVALCLPSTLIDRAARSLHGFAVGAQDVHHKVSGAHTGCVSAPMLIECGASLTIVGHSERRQDQNESDSDVRAKAEAALAHGLDVILCVGESLDIRDSGEAIGHVTGQLARSIPESLVDGRDLAIAYEPIWAIGTGRTASSADIDDMHQAIRERLISTYGDKGEGVRILYGGSVKASNAAEIFAIRDVDGALVGGASLKAEDFVPIVAAAAAS